MCFNDDFDFDGYDDMDGMDDDFSEDLFEDEFEPEMDELELQEEPYEPAAPESAFDFQDVFILGGMIVGLAYEEAQDQKEQQKQQNNEDDSEGEDLI